MSFRLADSSICVVGAHLSAHRGDVAGRNADYHAICERDCFRRGLGAWTRTAEGRHACRDAFGVLDHDVVLFLGDLNYRIIASVDDEEVFDLVRDGEIDRLAKLDQLNVARAKGDVFEHGFIEAPLTFAPTYKYATGSKFYDFELPEAEQAGRKIRCPAWCDRVLWRVRPTGPRAAGAPTESATCSSYDRGDERLIVSDHRAARRRRGFFEKGGSRRRRVER